MDTTGTAANEAGANLPRQIPTVLDDARSTNASPRRRRRRGRTRRTHFRTLTSVGTVLLGSILGLILVLVLWPDARPGSREAGRREGSVAAHEVSPRPASRPVLRYSVVAGGVYEASEVAAVKSRDPLVAQHYEDIVPAALRPTTVGQDRLVYVSYRKHDTIYWTKRRVLLRSGDAILTDGRREIRSRCGNRISMYPLLPVAEEEPTSMELDALVDGPQADPETQVAALPLLERRGPTALAFAPPVPSALSDVRTGTRLSNANGPSAATFSDDPGRSVFVGFPFFSNPPALADTQALGDPAPSTTTPDDPESVDSPGGGDPGGDPRTSDAPPAGPPTDGPPMTMPPGDPFPPAPQQPVPMPEPTTVLLVGGGLAGLVLRRMRAARSSSGKTPDA